MTARAETIDRSTLPSRAFAISIPLLSLLCLFAYRAPSRAGAGLTDPDYYWHLAYGEWILEHVRLPAADFWSWTADGRAYRLTQWLGELVMAIAHQAGGELGTSVLAALLVTLTMGASYRAARCFLDNRLAALAVAFGSNALLVSLACRPHQFTHLGLALLTWILATHQTTTGEAQRRVLYWIPPLFALWVNLHGGYAFGLAYLLLASTALAVDASIRREPPRAIATTLASLVVAGGAGLLATLLNPYGVGAWQYAIEIATMKASAAGIVDEWAATNIKTEIGLQYYLVTAALAAAMALSARRPPVADVVLALALCAIGWTAVRLSLMTTVLMVPLLAASLRDTAFYSLAFDGPGRRFDRAVPAWALLAVAAIGASAAALAQIDRTTERDVARQMPVAEAAFLRTHGIGGRILNPPEIGGYLIRTHGARVSLDTRYDLHGDHALMEFLFAQRGHAGWREYVARLDPDIILAAKQAPLGHLLADDGRYRAVFQGPSFAVLVRSAEHPSLPTITIDRPHADVLATLNH